MDNSIDRDLPELMVDFGVQVVCGFNAGLGIFDNTTRAEGFGRELADVLILEPSVMVEASQFPEAKVGVPISVGGLNYLVRDRKSMGDDKLIRLFLRLVP